MTTVLIIMLAANTVLHGLIVFRFGLPDNMPPAVFAVIYAVLTVLVLLAVPYALWAVLVISILGFIALLAAFNTIRHEKSIERVILVLDAAIALVTAYLLFIA